jgi:hypothetical protein
MTNAIIEIFFIFLFCLIINDKRKFIEKFVYSFYIVISVTAVRIIIELLVKEEIL